MKEQSPFDIHIPKQAEWVAYGIIFEAGMEQEEKICEQFGGWQRVSYGQGW